MTKILLPQGGIRMTANALRMTVRPKGSIIPGTVPGRPPVALYLIIGQPITGRLS
jgi:hypothetical protein